MRTSSPPSIRGGRIPVRLAMICLGLAASIALFNTPLLAGETKSRTATEKLQDRLNTCHDRLEELRGRQYQIEPLVVTLPDPIDSHFGRELDAMLAAISRGLGELHYLPDLQCLPWEPGSGARPIYREQPGLALFRKDDRVIVLLIVGETPVAGVHTQAFASALRTAYEELGKTSPNTRTVNILGPTFSGSAESINAGLSSWRTGLLDTWNQAATASKKPCKRRRTESTAQSSEGPLVTVRVISGSATASNLKETLHTGLEGDQRFKVEPFRSLVASNLELMSCVWNKLVPDHLGLETRFQPRNDTGTRLGRSDHCAPEAGRHDTDNERVALLVESSAYGRDFAESGFYVVQFPMHLWRLREQYEQLSKAAAAGEDGQEAELRLELKRRPRGAPIFGEGATVLSQDMVLKGLLRDLARQRFQVIGVVASDVTDKRFLIDRIREVAPGSRIITFEGDVLLAQRRGSSVPRGALVASSYPAVWPELEPGAEHSSEERPRIRNWRFPLDAAQGSYFAVQGLISKEAKTPPQKVWLSVIGNGTIETLEGVPLVDQDRPATAPEASPSATRAQVGGPGRVLTPSDRVVLPRGWWLLFALVNLGFLAALVHVVQHTWPAQAKAEGSAEGSNEDDGEATPAPRLLFGLIPIEVVRLPRWSRCGSLSRTSDRARHALAVLLPIVVGVPYFVLSFNVLLALPPAPTTDLDILSRVLSLFEQAQLNTVPLIVLCGLTFAVLYLLAGLTLRTVYDLVHLLRQARTWSSNRTDLSTRACVVALPLAATLVLVIGTVALGLYWFDKSTQVTSAPLLSARAFSLSTATSPLVPLLLFGTVLLGWIVTSLYRHRKGRAIPTLEEIEDRTQGVSEPLRCHVARLRRAIEPASMSQGRRLLWALLFLAPTAYLMLFYGWAWLPPLQSVEGAPYDWTASALFLMALAVTVGTGISLFRGWSAFRGLLDWLHSGEEENDEGEGNGESKGKGEGEGEGNGESKGWLKRVRKAYSEAESSKNLAEQKRLATLQELEAAIEAAPQEPPFDELRAWVSTCRERYGSAPAGRWLTIAAWREAGWTIPSSSVALPPKLEATAREFFTWSTVRFIHDAFVQLLHLMGFMTGALLVLLFAVTAYPFEPQQVLVVYVSSLMALGVALSVWIGTQTKGDKLLGALDSPAASPWPTFAGRLGLHAGLPALSFLTSQVPALRQGLFQWIEPLFKAFQ